MIDVSAIVIFHREGFLAPASIRSFTRACDRAAERGVRVERIAIVDRPDPLTQATVSAAQDAFDQVHVVEFGDLGQSRNEGRRVATGTYMTYFDGDDLWGDQWIWRAFEAAELPGANASAVFHPHVIYYFSADDYRVQSRTTDPPRASKSFYFIQQDSQAAGFDPRALIFNNIWTANSFGPRELYERFPYHAMDRTNGFGVEDWTWNAETLASGIRHAIVPETIHCVRLKATASLGQENTTSGILPSVYRFAEALEGLASQSR